MYDRDDGGYRGNEDGCELMGHAGADDYVAPRR
jgi:hypothetical protein